MYVIGYGKYLGLGKGHAYIGAIRFDGETYDYTVPDEYKGYKITALGGYHGTGYPCPFGIEVYDYFYEKYGDNVTIISRDEAQGADCVPLVFTVRLGVNVCEVENVFGSEYYKVGGNRKDGNSGDGSSSDKDNGGGDNGEETVYYVAYNFIVDENNPHLYSVDGRLYERESKKLIEDFIYESTL